MTEIDLDDIKSAVDPLLDSPYNAHNGISSSDLRAQVKHLGTKYAAQAGRGEKVSKQIWKATKEYVESQGWEFEQHLATGKYVKTD